jgi:hypothetical protein
MKQLFGTANGNHSSERIGSELIGVLELLKGILISPDEFDGAQLLLTEIPTIVVQGTEDSFVDPKSANIFKEEYLPANRVVVKEVADCLDDNAVYLTWLRAGHELMQEKTSYILGLLSNMVQICGIKPITFEEFSDDEKTSTIPNGDGMEEITDVLELAALRKKKKKEELERIEEENRQKFLAQAEQMKQNLKQAEIDRRLWEEEQKEKQELAEQERIRLEKEEEAEEIRLQILRDQEEQELRAKSDKEKAKKRAENHARRLQMAADRKEKEEILAREAEKELYRERELLEQARQNEIRELKKMRKEDSRSAYAAQYMLDLEINELTKELAKSKSVELDKFRNEELLRQHEEQLARERYIFFHLFFYSRIYYLEVFYLFF